MLVGQNAAHRPFGGVVPEIAARAHVEILAPLIRQVMAEAGVGVGDVDAIAATAGPGLIGGVMVGFVTGKALALATGKPLIAVNHLEGHALSPRLVDPDAPRFPICCFWYRAGIANCWKSRVSGGTGGSATTIDDAVGEAFDKTAKLLGLAFPAGRRSRRWRRGRCDGRAAAAPAVGSASRISPSPGLKSAVARACTGRFVPTDIARAFQQAVVDCLVDRTARALAASYDARRSGRGRRRRGEPAVRRRSKPWRPRKRPAASSRRRCGCAPTMRP